MKDKPKKIRVEDYEASGDLARQVLKSADELRDYCDELAKIEAEQITEETG